MRTLLSIFLCFILTAQQSMHSRSDSPAIASAKSQFLQNARLLNQACQSLQFSIQRLKPGDERSVASARFQLKNARSAYKRIESFLEYFFPATARIYNSPPTYETEEPFNEYQEPMGFQVMESLLFGKINAAQKLALAEQAHILFLSSADFPSLLYHFHPQDAELVESFRVELIRVMALGIAGYDAPQLQSGISESATALHSVRVQLKSFVGQHAEAIMQIDSLLQKAILYLEGSARFSAFNRLYFIRYFAIPLQSEFFAFVWRNKIEFPGRGIVNQFADNLFMGNALLPDRLTPHADTSATMRLLGKQLFSNALLSRSGVKSCASCHDPAKRFTDGRATGLGLNGRNLSRNTPSLLYCAFQHGQFWDGRAKSLEDQIIAVLSNSVEMDIDRNSVNERLLADSLYRSVYCKFFSGESPDSSQNLTIISRAIAAYMRSLHPMNAAFDRYLQGDDQAMTFRQMNGFNLFMGKAKCGTCHFIPLFNGLIPPHYALTAYEVIGIPLTENLNNPQLDMDSGKYLVYPLWFNLHAFKTPTLRNIEQTPPYMHNGAFHSLEQVVAFYNKGGGTGLGLSVPNQTLSHEPLYLNDTEQKDIVLFMHALTDTQ